MSTDNTVKKANRSTRCQDAETQPPTTPQGAAPVNDNVGVMRQMHRMLLESLLPSFSMDEDDPARPALLSGVENQVVEFLAKTQIAEIMDPRVVAGLKIF